jgi:hypothetical protein
MKSFRLLLILLPFIWYGCGEDNSDQDASGEDRQDSTITVNAEIDQEAVGPAESAGILGRWELVEKRIPTPIKLSGTFFTFDSEGKLTISSPNDPDLEDLIIPFTYVDSSLRFDTEYQLEFVSGDSMVLTSETDGIREVNILKRK